MGRFVSEYFTPLTLDTNTEVISDEDTVEIWGSVKELAIEKVRRNKNRTSGGNSTVIDVGEVERSFWISRPDGWVVNTKMKKIILLEVKRTDEYSEAYYRDMRRVTEQQNTPILTGLGALVTDRGWEVDGKKILRKLGLTLLNEHEKLFCSYWCQTFGPSSSLL